MERPMAQQLDDLSRSLMPLEQDSTIIAVIEMSQASWLVAGIVPGIERHPLKKLEPSEAELVRLLKGKRARSCHLTPRLEPAGRKAGRLRPDRPHPRPCRTRHW